MARLNELDDIMKENGMLRNRLSSLGEKAKTFSDRVTSNVNRLFINYLGDYDGFISKTVATHCDLENYTSLGKKIAWNENPIQN